MHFIEDGQPLLEAAEMLSWLGQLGAVSVGIEIDRRSAFADRKGERRFAYLTRPQNGHGRASVKELLAPVWFYGDESSLHFWITVPDLQGTLKRSHRVFKYRSYHKTIGCRHI